MIDFGYSVFRTRFGIGVCAALVQHVSEKQCGREMPEALNVHRRHAHFHATRTGSSEISLRAAAALRVVMNSL